MINLKKNGFGIFTWNNGNIYRGNFEDGFINGEGIFEDDNEII